MNIYNYKTNNNRGFLAYSDVSTYRLIILHPYAAEQDRCKKKKDSVTNVTNAEKMKVKQHLIIDTFHCRDYWGITVVTVGAYLLSKVYDLLYSYHWNALVLMRGV